METLPANRPNAWLLDFGPGLLAAVGTRVLLQIMEDPALHTVPYTPPQCRNVLSWKGRLLPVIDMAALLGGAPLSSRLLVVAAYREQSGEALRFGAFLLSSPPVAITVDDDQACPLPEQPGAWSKFAVSSFGHQGEAIPVLHLARIFSSLPDA